MKKRVLIVEDDKYFRFAVKKVIDWQKYGFEIVGEAVHGVAALEFLKENQAEIVITDMSMPVMNGIELTATLKEEYPQILIIALSAYDDFEFVKESLKLGAQDYILKQDIEKEDVAAIIQRCWDKHLKDMALDNQIRADILRFLCGEEGDGRKFLEVCMDNQWGCYVCKIENLNPEWVSAVCRKSSWLEESLLELHDKKEHILFLPVKKECSLKRQYEEWNRILDELEHLLEEEAYLGGCSNKSTHIEDIQKMNQEADESIQIGRFSKKKKIRKWEIAKERIKMRNKNYIENTQLYNEINTQEDAVKALKALTENLCMKLPLEENVQKNYLQFINIVSDNLHIEIEKLEFARIKEELANSKLVWKKHEVCVKYINHLFSDEMQNTLHPCVLQGIHYMKQNYDRDLSLGEIAEQVALNESYFSGIFKRDTGKSIPEYLNEIRIEKAKILIQDTTLRNYEIAEHVGFGNGSYFSTIFKKQTGITIQEYRHSAAKKAIRVKI